MSAFNYFKIRDTGHGICQIPAILLAVRAGFFRSLCGDFHSTNDRSINAPKKAASGSSCDFFTQTSCGAECSETCGKHRVFGYSSGSRSLAGCGTVQYRDDEGDSESRTIAGVLEQHRVFVVLPRVWVETVRSACLLRCLRKHVYLRGALLLPRMRDGGLVCRPVYF